MAAAGSSSENPFHRKLLGHELHHTPEQRGILPGKLVKLYTCDERNERPLVVGFGIAQVQPGLGPDEPKKFRSQLHGHDLQPHMMVLEDFRINQSMPGAAVTILRNLEYPYKNNYQTSDDRIDKLGGLEGSRVPFVWDNRAMVPCASIPGTGSFSSTRSNQNRPTNDETSTALVEDVTDSVKQIAVVDLVHDDEEKEKIQDSAGRDFKREDFDISIYDTVLVRIKITQIRDVETPLRKEQEKHVNKLKESMLDPRIGYQKNKGFMTVTLLEKDIGPNYSLHSVVAAAQSGTGYTIPEVRTTSIVDGRHRRRAINDITKMNDERYDWSRDYFDVHLRFRRDFKIMSDWEVLMLSSSENNVSAVVLESTSVVDILQSIDSYATIFDKTYKIRFQDAKITSIFEDLKATNFLGTMSDTTIKRYIRWSKNIRNYESVRSFLYGPKCTFANETRGKHNNVTYLNEFELYNSSEHEMYCMLVAAEAFYQSSKDSKKRFYAKHFYIMCRYFIDRLRTVFNNISNGQSTLPSPPPVPMDFKTFMNTPYNSTMSIKLEPMETLQNVMKTFHYEESDSGLKAKKTAKAIMSRAVRKMYNHYGVPDPDSAVVEPRKKTTPGTTPGTSGPPSRNLRRNSDAVIDLNDDGNQPKPKKQRTRRGTRHPDTKVKSPDKNTRSQSTKTKKSNRPSTSLSVITINDNNNNEGGEEDEDEPFDDSIDLDKVPSGYEDMFSIVKENFQTDADVTMEDIMRWRLFPFLRNRDQEAEICNNRLVVPADESFNGNPIYDTSIYLRSIGIPEHHRAHLFVDLECLKFYRNMACLNSIHQEQYKTGGIHDISHNMSLDFGARWQTSLARYRDTSSYNHSLSGIAYYDRKKQEYNSLGYTILEGMGDPLGFRADISVEELRIQVPPSCPTMSNAVWFTTLYGMFPGEGHLVNESNRTEWNPICNTGDRTTDRRNDSLGIARYQSTNRFLTEVLEQNDNIQLAYKRAHLDVWIAVLASFLGLDNATVGKSMEEHEQLFLPVTGGRLLFTGKNCVVQTGHNDFLLRLINQLAGCFCIVTGLEEVNLWATDHSHKFIFYPENTKKELIERLHMKRVTIPGNSVFFGHGYLHHAGDKYLGSHCLRYHVYLRPQGVEIPNAIMFQHGGGHGPKVNADGTIELGIPKRNRAAANNGETSTNVDPETSPVVTTPNRKRIEPRRDEMELDDDSDSDADRAKDPDFNADDDIVPRDVPDE